MYADEQLAQRLNDEEYRVVDRVQDSLTDYCLKRIWLSLPDPDAAERLRTELRDDLMSFCRIIARSEKAVYDTRARTLRDAHPLAPQVNLATGVANGAKLGRP